MKKTLGRVYSTLYTSLFTIGSLIKGQSCVLYWKVNLLFTHFHSMVGYTDREYVWFCNKRIKSSLLLSVCESLLLACFVISCMSSHKLLLCGKLEWFYWTNEFLLEKRSNRMYCCTNRLFTGSIHSRCVHKVGLIFMDLISDGFLAEQINIFSGHVHWQHGVDGLGWTNQFQFGIWLW